LDGRWFTLRSTDCPSLKVNQAFDFFHVSSE